MAVPTSYTDDELAEYMASVLGTTGGVLGLTTDDYKGIVPDVLLAYGVTTIDQATDIAKLRALARREVWRLAMARAAGMYNWSADGGRYERSQLWKQIQAQFALAESDAARYDPNVYGVGISAFTSYDPYTPPEVV